MKRLIVAVVLFLILGAPACDDPEPDYRGQCEELVEKKAECFNTGPDPVWIDYCVEMLEDENSITQCQVDCRDENCDAFADCFDECWPL